MTRELKKDVAPSGQSGTYFLRTSLTVCEKLLWDVYHIIRETEYSFRTLKTDLDLRPVYHRKDASTMAHLHPGLLACRAVNTVRYQLKRKQADADAPLQAENTEAPAAIAPVINFQWKEIIRIMNTQKAVMTVSQNRYGEVIITRRCSDPKVQAGAIYRRLKYKPLPCTKRKFVVHKSVFEKMDLPCFQHFII
ncbi:MAG: hypothetical protein LBF85_04025 [Tannerella sp.]|jgi:hypothetical protein|nr:hypothetical protein [Tannerella sp.]